MTQPNQHTKGNNSRNADQDGSKKSGSPHKGSVQHSDDGRLKENRDQGVHRGDKE
jgi:hypothetical protein